MSYIESLTRIDRYLCKFENPILEQDFTSHRLKKISRLLTFSYFLFSVAIAADIYDLYSGIESLHPLMLMNVVISISMLFLGLSRGELNSQWDENKLSTYWKNHGINTITMRTGIHTGSVIAGNIGSPEMLQYSTIGDTVNVASRIEQANKEFNTEISFSQEIYTALEEKLFGESKLSGEITLKGRTKPTKVYSI